ncbi:MAG: cysteine desulfurase [Verrucomicrobia bacterium]|nr:cysteine desulfurase [Verrucomicrobiota bacterium]NBU07795.1 cysteine desulfurase [Pseudomonadota bacterium]NDA67826.1 cysteine desulfurase [Verrucomicrobiota bacterium]NDB76388.1 cysteine desulfurase [Verrucomicrobiota bacterium]NDD39537.1 cysteine desulfurase [Verrucomicrobiota bacterium]
MLYFDHNATSPLHPAARQAWLDASERFIGNPSSPHRIGARADAALSEARERLARILGCDALDLVFTSGATESANTVFHHAARTIPPDAEVWLSAIEHPCVTAAARHHFAKRLRWIPVTREGVLDRNWLEKQLKRSHPRLIAVMAANNETGVVQPWHDVLRLCRERDVPFLCDAVQWIGKLRAQGLGECDFTMGSAHKFGGPRGVGFLKCPKHGRFEPLLRGGSQEEARRAGTENVPGVLAMLAALEVREESMKDDLQSRSHAIVRKCGLQRAMIESILNQLPGTEIVGAKHFRLWNTICLLMPEVDCRVRWVVKLDKLGVAVSTGSACASGKEEPSPVLTAMGYTPAQAARALRFSAGWETTREDWEQLLDLLLQAQLEIKPRRKK